MSTATARDRIPGALRERLSGAVSQMAAAGALIVVFVFLSIASPDFLTVNNLFNVGVQISVTAVIAVGITLVIITAGIDLSVGSVAALAGVLGVMTMVNLGFSPVLAIIAGTLVGAGAGLVNGFLITVADLPPFIATLGMLTVARGLVYVVTGGVAVFGAPDSFRLLGQGVVASIPIPIIALAVVAMAGYVVLSRTRLGRYAYAIGSNPEAARLSGIPVKRYLLVVYVIGGALAGFGGMIAASQVNSGQPNYGIGLELDIIAAAVIGGASLFGGQGTIFGTLIGAFLIALIRDGAVLLGVNTFYQQILIGVVIWLAVYWDQLRRRKIQAASE
jgi:ribose transport system permease protein